MDEELPTTAMSRELMGMRNGARLASWVLLVLGVLVGAGAGLAIDTRLEPDDYTSISRIQVEPLAPISPAEPAAANRRYASQRVDSYVRLASSPAVTDPAGSTIGLAPGTLQGSVSARVGGNGNVITVAVRGETPAVARERASAVTVALASTVARADTTSTGIPRVRVDVVTEPTTPSGNVLRFAAAPTALELSVAGAMLGLLVAGLVITRPAVRVDRLSPGPLQLDRPRRPLPGGGVAPPEIRPVDRTEPAPQPVRPPAARPQRAQIATSSLLQPVSGVSDRLSNHGLVLLVLGVVLLLTIRQTFAVPNTGLGLSPAQLIFLGCGVLWLLRFFAGRTGQHGLGGIVVLQVCTLVAAYAAAFSRPLTTEESLGASRSLQQVVTIGLLTLFVMDTLRTRDDVATLIRWTVAAGAVAAALALLSRITGIDLGTVLTPPGLQPGAELLTTGLEREGVTRTQGTAQHPLELGAVMAFLTPLAVSCAVISRQRSRSSMPWVVATSLIVAALLTSVSRSGVAAMVVGLLVMMMFWPLRRNLVAASLATLTVGPLLLAGLPMVNALITSAQGTVSTDDSLASRATGWSYVLELFSERPLFGLGLGTYVRDDQPYIDNQYLGYLAEAGLIGLTGAVLLALCTLGVALQLQRGHGRLTADIAGGLAGAVVASLVMQVALDTGGFVQISTLIACAIGCVGALRAASLREPVTV